MLRAHLVPPILLLIAGAFAACKRDPEPAAASAPPDRRTRCLKIAGDLTTMGMAMAQGLAVGLSEGKAKLEGAEKDELRAELETAERELVEQCMDWPEEALDCFGFSGVMNSKKCERILASAMGEPVLPDDVPPGPGPAWQFELPDELTTMIGRDDGSVIVVVEPESPAEGAPRALVVAVADGAERWRHALASAPFALEPLDAGPVLAVADREITALDPTDGQVRWTARAPMADDAPVELVAVARAGADVFVLDGRRQVSRVDVARCAAGTECLPRVLTADVPETWGTQWLEPGNAGGWVIVAADDALAHAIDPAGKRRFTIAAHTTLSWVEARGDALRVGADGAIAVLDAARCGEEGRTFAPIPWPPQGKAKWVADTTVRTIEADPPPPGCVRWSSELGVTDASDEVAWPGDATWVQSGGFLFGFDAAGTRTVRTPVVATSLVVAVGDALVVAGDLGGDETQLVLTWLSATGEHRRRSALPLGQGKMLLFDDVALVRAGTGVVAGLERRVVGFGG